MNTSNRFYAQVGLFVITVFASVSATAADLTNPVAPASIIQAPRSKETRIQVFSRDYIPILQLLVTTTGLVSLVLLWRQTRESANWNKRNTILNKVQTHLENFSESASNPQYERAAHEALKTIGVSMEKELSQEAVNKILLNDSALFAIRHYLNDYEEFCAAVRVGTVDSDFSFALNSFLVTKCYKVFRPFIIAWRSAQGDEDIWIELERLATDWGDRTNHDNDRLKSIREERDALAKLLNDAKEREIQSLKGIIAKL